MQSEKRHLLEYAKPSNSTLSPALPRGGSQARAGDFPTVQGTSRMASMERLATSLGCSFDGCLRDTQKSTSKTEPRLDPEPHPTALSDDSDEMQTQSRKDREDADQHDVAFRSRLVIRNSPTPLLPREIALGAPNRQVVVANVPTLGHSPHASVYVLPNAINSVSRLNVSEKRHPLGDPKTLSPTLPPGRSQTRAGDSLSVQESSSKERVATGPRRSFDGSLGGMPATITSEVAGTGIGPGVEENREQPEVLPSQSATATSADRGAQADQEEFRATSPKDAERSTSKSEPRLDPKSERKPGPKSEFRLDPEPHPTAASDSKEVDAVEAESDGIDPMPPFPNVGAVDGIEFLNIGPKESDELRTQSRKEQEDAFLRSVTVHSGFKTSALRTLEAAPMPQVVVTSPDHSQRRSAYILPNAINSVSPPDATLADVSPRDDTRNVHTSDGEHTGCCIMCGFKLL